MKRSIVFTFNRKLTKEEEEYFISAFQETVMAPAGKAINAQAKKFSSGFYGMAVKRSGAGAMLVSKLEMLGTDIRAWMDLKKESETIYVFSYNLDALSALVFEIPKQFHPYIGKKLAIGKFLPESRIINNFKRNIFSGMHLQPGDVKICLSQA